MDKHDDPYEILGVEHDADESTIKKAYFKLARQYHPDKQETEEEKQTVNSKFAKISDAYDLLNDTVRLYDWTQDYQERQSRPSVHSRQRRRSNSPHHYQARRYSARRSPGSLSPKRRQSPGPPSMPQSKASSPRRPPPGSRPRTVRTVKRSVSPVPPQNGSSPGRHSSGRHSPGQYQSRNRKGLSPSAHRTRRTTSILPPRQSPGAYRQSPGTLRRKVHSTNPPAQRPNIRRPSSSGLSPPPPPVSRASFGSSPQLNPPQQSRSSWSSFTSNNNQMKSEENPFEILELHWRADKVEVISAYRELAQQLHSSKTHASEKERIEAAERLIQVTWAYDTLRDPKQLQEWQQKCKASGNDSNNKFHNSMNNSKGGWFQFHSRGKDDDDESSLIGNEEGDAKSMRSSSRISSRRGESSTLKRKGKPMISLLSNLGLPGQKESSEQEAVNDGQEKKASRFPKFGFLGRKDASAVAAEDEAPQETPTSDIQEDKSVKKKKKKKKKVPTNGDEAVDEDDAQTRKTKKKRKKKDRPKAPKPVDYSWKREESKRVMEDSVRTANETIEEGSDDSLEHEHSILLTG